MAQAVTAYGPGRSPILIQQLRLAFPAAGFVAHLPDYFKAKGAPSATTLERRTAAASAWKIIPTKWITRA